jgi:hypothetical protein
MRFIDEIEVKQNLRLIVRERGKIVERRDGHNIFLNLGREWLSQLIAYTTFGPLTGERDDRIRYMGFGIGGNRQLQLGTAPIITPYPGTNAQTDSDPTLTVLERPVRLSGSTDPYPGQGSDVWLGQVQAPPVHPLPTQVTFSRVFTSTEISYGPLLSVPLSEIMLFTNAANPNVYNNTGVAYDTFDTLSKTTAFELEVNWTLRF